eukprot:1507833-Amphidinium_carterae.1
MGWRRRELLEISSRRNEKGAEEGEADSYTFDRKAGECLMETHNTCMFRWYRDGSMCRVMETEPCPPAKVAEKIVWSMWGAKSGCNLEAQGVSAGQFFSGSWSVLGFLKWQRHVASAADDAPASDATTSGQTFQCEHGWSWYQVLKSLMHRRSIAADGPHMHRA